MAVAFRQGASDTHGSSSAAITLTWSGAAPPDGDRMVAMIGVITQTTITAPTGWTLLGQQDNGTSLRMWAYYRDAASEPSSNVWSLASATKSWAYVGSYSGVDLTVAPPLFAMATSSGTAMTAPSITLLDQSWLITAVTGRHTNTGAVTTWTINDASAAERLDFASNVTSSNDVSGAYYDSNRALTPAGAYARTVTASQSEALAALMQVGLSPAGSGGGTPPPTGTGVGARWGVHL